MKRLTLTPCLRKPERRNSMFMVNGNARDSVICGEIVKLVRMFEKNGAL